MHLAVVLAVIGRGFIRVSMSADFTQIDRLP